MGWEATAAIQRVLIVTLVIQAAAAADVAAADVAAPPCGEFITKGHCDVHPLRCRWSRPNHCCLSKNPPEPPPIPPPPAPPRPLPPKPLNRTALFWLVPYPNLTTVADYTTAWAQFGENQRPGYIMAGSAYALKPNGSLGYADTKAGEGVAGELMERCGFPALKRMGLRTIAMVYVTHTAAIKKMVANPEPFIAQLLAKAQDVGIDGFDVDYEPQQMEGSEGAQFRGAFMAFLARLASELEHRGMTLTIDVGGCPTFNDFSCAAADQITGLAQTNCMHTFGSRSLTEFKMLAQGDKEGLGSKWAPGFEPGNMKTDPGSFRQILDYLKTQGVSTLATWEVHELNLGVPQPQWLFDHVNAFLD